MRFAIFIANCFADVQWSMDVLTGHQEKRLQKELSAVCTAAGLACKPGDVTISYRPKNECSNGQPIRGTIVWTGREPAESKPRLERLIRDCVVRFIPQEEVEISTEEPATEPEPSSVGA